jgi:type IV pilus assembly protein PilA
MRRLRSNIRRRRGQAFTLIELLVVVLILAILMAVSMVPYLSAVTDSQKKTCRANLQTIATAVHAARVKNLAPDFAGLIAGGVSTTSLPDLTTVPLCPTGGSYSLANGASGNTTTFKVLCSAMGHGSYEPGVDGN